MNESLLKECTYIQARAAAALIEMEAMKFKNLMYPGTYREKDFMKLIERNGLEHNQICSAFQNCY